MKLDVLSDADAVAAKGATMIADAARAAIKERGRFILAVSGGRTPWVMMAALAREDLPWDSIHVTQVDERIAPADSPDRNLMHLRETLLSRVPLPAENMHAMPVESDDVAAAAAAYGRTLEALAGTPPALDLIHLGLGPDGHTASLIPGDPVLEVTDAFVATTGIYQGCHRMTVTYPVLDHARRVLFVVTGDEKAKPLAQLMRRDRSIPAGRIAASNVMILADQPAAAEVHHG